MHFKLDLSALIDLQSFWSEGELILSTRGERLVQYLSLLSCLSLLREKGASSTHLYYKTLPLLISWSQFSLDLLYLHQNEHVSYDNMRITNACLMNGLGGVV